MLDKDYTRKFSVEKIMLVVSLKWLVAKTNWRQTASRKVILTLTHTND
jgi:hypothetical protein